MARILSPRLLELASFRDGLTTFVRLTPTQIEKLRVVIEDASGFSAPDELIARVARELEIPQDQSAKIVAVTAFLYDEVSPAGSTTQLLQELRDASGEGESALTSAEDAIARLFAPIPAYDLNNLRRQAIESAMPVLEDMSVYCDIRTVPDPAKPDTLKGYVPVLVARCTFDEPIAGQIGIAFQITDNGLNKIEEALRQARKQLEQAKLDMEGKLI